MQESSHQSIIGAVQLDHKETDDGFKAFSKWEIPV
jgi:hypothetical protein